MGVQISRGIHSQVSKKGVVRGTGEVSGKVLESRIEEAFDAGSRIHADNDSAEVWGVTDISLSRVRVRYTLPVSMGSGNGTSWVSPSGREDTLYCGRKG